MKDKFNLSERIQRPKGIGIDNIYLTDVKKFIISLKFGIEYMQKDCANLKICNKEDIIKLIDKLTGKEFTKKSSVFIGKEQSK